MKISLLSLPGKVLPGTRILHKFLLSTFLVLLSFIAIGQVAGDYRSISSGDWSSTGTWEYYNGATWVAATTYPGESADVGTITIQSPNVITADIDIVAFAIETLYIEGAGRLEVDFNTTRELNIAAVYVVPDGIYNGPNFTFQTAQSAFRLPPNAFISYPAGYTAFPTSGDLPNGNCNNNNSLYIGGGTFGGTEVKYSACTGGGNVCVIFSEMNDVGGTVYVESEVELELDSEQAFGNTSCKKVFNAKITISGVLAASEVDLTLIGTPPVGESISFSGNPWTGLTDLSDGVADGKIVVSTTITTSAAGTYQIQADATLETTSSCTTPLIITTTTYTQIIIRPALDVTVNAPTSVCLSEVAYIEFTNNSLVDGIRVTYRDGGGFDIQQNIAANSTAQILIPTVSVGNINYEVRQYRYQSPPAPPGCADTPLVNMYPVSVGDATSLAVDGDTKTQNLQVSSLITASQGCRVIADVDNTPVTVVNARAYVNGDVLEYSGRPFVGRRIMVHPTGATGSAEFTLYALQDEFTDFNNSPINNIDLPQNPADVEGYAANVRIIKFEEGDFDINTGLPTGNVQATATEIVPTSVMWDAVNNWWEIKFPVADFSLFIISNPTFVILPLKLVSFDAKLNGKRNASLSWTTTEEKNLRSFDVETSKDGSLFNKVGEVQAKNLSTGANYTFSTAMPGKLGYFRLKMIDKDGAFSFSPIKTLKTDNLIITSYPNPVKDQMIVDLTGYPSGTMRIVDMNGRTLGSYKTVDGINRINTSSLGTGIYLLQVNVGLETEKLKFSKVDR